MMEERISMVLLGGIAAWTALFLAVRKILEKRSFDFCNRAVSLVHVAVAVWLSSVSVQDWRHPLHPPASPPSPAQVRTLTVTLSYFIYDFICCLFDTNFNMSNFIHHTVSILGIGSGLLFKACGSELTGCLWLMEISNPFMHMRQLLRESGHRDSTFSIINDVCFAIVFAFGRLICGPYLLYVTLTHENPIIIKAAASGLQAVSLFWFWKILTMVRKEMVKAKKLRKTL